MRLASVRDAHFYDAFYRLTRLITSPQPCSRPVSNSALRRSAEASADRNNVHRLQMRVSDNAQIINAKDRLDRLLPAAVVRRTDEDDCVHTFLKTEDVEARSDRPSESLVAWQHVIRSRTPTGVLYEIALPSEAIDKLVSLNGRNFEMFKSRFGAKVERGPNFQNVVGQNTQSLLISGTCTAVSRVISIIFDIGRDLMGEDDFRQANRKCMRRDKLSLTKIAIPEAHANSAGHVAGPNGAGLEEVHRVTKALYGNPSRNGTFSLRGSHGRVALAKSMLQKRLSHGCQRIGFPNFRFEEVDSGWQDRALNINHDPEASEHLADDMKLAARSLTNPVVLLTSRDDTIKREGDISGDAQLAYRGVTVSSFNTITMSPIPVVSFNIRTPSRSWDAINSSGLVCIHILQANTLGASLADAFTQRYDSPSEPFRKIQAMGARLESSVLAVTDRGPPQVHLSGAVLARITAQLRRSKCVQIGDHIVVFAGVTHVDFPPQARQDAARELVDQSDGLAYSSRAYRGIGTKIHLDDTQNRSKSTNVDERSPPQGP